MNNPRTFTCEACKGTFLSKSTEVGTREEYEKLFGQKLDAEQVVIVCHQCWLLMGCDRIGIDEC